MYFSERSHRKKRFSNSYNNAKGILYFLQLVNRYNVILTVIKSLHLYKILRQLLLRSNLLVLCIIFYEEWYNISHSCLNSKHPLVNIPFN